MQISIVNYIQHCFLSISIMLIILNKLPLPANKSKKSIYLYTFIKKSAGQSGL